MRLTRANAMLRSLLALFKKKRIPMPKSVKIVHNTDIDARNKKRPRSIAQVELGHCFVAGWANIECSRAIERLFDEDMAGVLLHELAHVATEAEEGDPEVNVDAFVHKNFPEARYRYGCIEDMDGRELKNIEMVSSKFLESLK